MSEESFTDLVEALGQFIDLAGVAIIVLGLVLAAALFARDAARKEFADGYSRCRQRAGKAILLGLEFLVAADIIRTVAIEPSFRGLGLLALIVLIRTFLSFTLTLELEGRWPWQRKEETGSKEADQVS